MENYEWDDNVPGKPSKDNKTDQIRDILFGETLRALEQRFNQMTEQIASINSQIALLQNELEQTKKAIQDLGNSSGTERETLRSLLQDRISQLESKITDIDSRKVDKARIVAEFVDKIKKD